MLIASSFKPAWWASNRHLQTIWGALRCMPALPKMQRLRLELADGDFIDVDLHKTTGNLPEQSTYLLLHGLEGSLESHYIQGLVSTFIKQGKDVAVMNFRGCSGESNRLLRSYHSGASDDLQSVLQLLQHKGLKVDYLVGFSLGGNILLKWLGECHPNHSVKAAVAVSVPLLLNECAEAIDTGFSRVYSSRLLKTLKQKALQKKQQFGEQLNISVKEINAVNCFSDFDHQITAPLHGFASGDDYYQKASSRQFLKHIQIPTLVIHAKDDPFMNHKVIPTADELSPSITFELSEKGGHVGFVQGAWPWQVSYYLESRIPEFLAEYEDQLHPIDELAAREEMAFETS